jgi:putative glycerol-1-phosphate prenyltransferase
MTDIPLHWPGAPDWHRWRHVTKLDPERHLPQQALDLVLSSGTDAVILGGSTGVTQEAVSSLLSRLQDAPIPVALEVSSLEAAMPGPALFLIPLVLNTADSDWLIATQTEALTKLLPIYGPIIPWHLLLPEAYLILNPACTAARLTGAVAPLETARAAAYAAFAGRVLRLPLLYVEYSGAFGDMQLLQAIKENCGEAHLVYGGGINSAERAAAAGEIADTIVVGNLVYERPDMLKETVRAAKS